MGDLDIPMFMAAYSFQMLVGAWRGTEVVSVVVRSLSSAGGFDELPLDLDGIHIG